MKNITDMNSTEFQEFMLDKCNAVAHIMKEEAVKKGEYGITNEQYFQLAKDLVLRTWLKATEVM